MNIMNLLGKVENHFLGTREAKITFLVQEKHPTMMSTIGIFSSPYCTYP